MQSSKWAWLPPKFINEYWNPTVAKCSLEPSENRGDRNVRNHVDSRFLRAGAQKSPAHSRLPSPSSDFAADCGNTLMPPRNGWTYVTVIICVSNRSQSVLYNTATSMKHRNKVVNWGQLWTYFLPSRSAWVPTSACWAQRSLLLRKARVQHNTEGGRKIFYLQGRMRNLQSSSRGLSHPGRALFWAIIERKFYSVSPTNAELSEKSTLDLFFLFTMWHFQWLWTLFSHARSHVFWSVNRRFYIVCPRAWKRTKFLSSGSLEYDSPS